MASPTMAHLRKQLQKKCLRTLQYYVLSMQESCELLSELHENGLIPDDERERILAHRKQELFAYAAYAQAQKRLWTLLTELDPRLVRLPDVLPAG